MARNRTTGALYVADNTVASINQVLQQIQNILDAIKGLRGPQTLHDRFGVSEPEDDADAVNKGSLVARETLFQSHILASGACGVVAIAPGTTYTDVGPLLRTRINFDASASMEGRLIFNGWGSEAGNGKGVALYTLDGSKICEVEWNGQAEGVRVGEYTSTSGLEDQTVAVYTKGSSATENLVLRSIQIEFRLTAGSALEEAA